MPYEHDRPLTLSHEYEKGFFHFVLYSEPGAPAGSAINGSQIVDPSGPYANEWLNRLVPCDPDALHVAIAGSDARSLWDPCVYTDPESPSAVAGDGCLCWQTLRDPQTMLPVASNHYRTVSGNIEHWRHFTCAPLALPQARRARQLVIDRESGVFWVRTDDDVLHILPEKQGEGYNIGYQGGGPYNLALMIEKIVESDGRDLSAGLPRKPKTNLRDWLSRSNANYTRELSLEELKQLYSNHRL